MRGKRQMESARLAKLVKLRDKADAHGTTEEERGLYFEKVTELMASWAVNDALLEVAYGGATARSEAIMTDYLVPEGTLTLSHGFAVLGCRIIEAFNGQGFTWKPDPRRPFVYGVVFVGYESDVERAKWLWESLCGQVVISLEAAQGDKIEWSFMSRNQKDVFRNTYLRAYGRAVGDRLRAAVRQVVEASDHVIGNELVLVERRMQVETWRRQNVKISLGRHRTYSVEGHHAGTRDGHEADLGTGTLPAGRSPATQRAIGA
jgi:hypothetical protein